MKYRFLSRLLAATAAATLAACGGAGPQGPAPTLQQPPPAAGQFGRFVGVGDSLTAGEQSGGWLGATNVANPLCPGGLACPQGPIVPPTQESGFWSQMWMQMNLSNPLTPYGALATPATSVLPLIAGPGLGNQIVPADPSLTGGVPFGTIPGRSGCDGFNQAAYSPTTAAQTVRMNPGIVPANVGIPGITLHESIAMHGPISPTCVPFPGAPPTVTGLQQLLADESANYYPALGAFTGVSPLTQLNAAVSLKPTLTTVWLGANDVLHYAFSGGTFTAVDGIGGNVGQVTADMTTVITALQNAGSKVVVANLPNVLEIPFYMSVAPVPGGAASCVTPGAPGTLQTYLACVLASVPAIGGYNNAAALTAAVAAGFGLNPGSGSPSINGGYGFVTLGGTITILTALGHGQQPNLDPNGPGSGLGQNYVTPALAQNIQALNDTLNSGIAAAAANTKVPMVDIHTLFNDIATANVSDPLAAIALGGVGPGCCSLTFGGGLLSYDGIHPSNTGYALVAQAFIQTINAAYNLGIPINPATFVKNQHDGTGTIPFHDPYAR